MQAETTQPIRYSFPAEFMDNPEYDQHITATIKEYLDMHGSIEVEVIIDKNTSIKATITRAKFYAGAKCRKYYPEQYTPQS